MKFIDKPSVQFLFLAAVLVSCFGCAKTDDVDIPIPVDPLEGYDMLLPDKAFGEYLVYLEIPGVLEVVDTLESGATQVNFYLNPDLVVSVNSLQLSKTSSNIAALESAGLATAAQKIADVTGIEYFTGLDTLVLTSNNLTALDLSGNPSLVELNMNFCKVEALDVTGCPLLKKLRFRGSAQANSLLSSIDLSNNTDLRHIHLRAHNFSNVDLSANTALIEEIDFSDNPGPDGNSATPDILIPQAIYDQVESAGGVLLGVTGG